MIPHIISHLNTHLWLHFQLITFHLYIYPKITFAPTHYSYAQSSFANSPTTHRYEWWVHCTLTHYSYTHPYTQSSVFHSTITQKFTWTPNHHYVTDKIFIVLLLNIIQSKNAKKQCIIQKFAYFISYLGYFMTKQVPTLHTIKIVTLY